MGLFHYAIGNVDKVIFSSSSSVYGDTSELPTSEKTAVKPNSPYALQKRTCEEYAKLFASLYGLEIVSLRYFNAYGPRQLGDSPYSTAISSWCHKVKLGEPLRSDGDGEQTRDMVYVGDIVNANMLAANAPAGMLAGEVFNIATGRRYSNNEILAKRAKHLTTTAKLPHKWYFDHDMVGYNYRMPNINAALLIAQLEKLNDFIINKRNLANKYEAYFKSTDYNFFKEPKDCQSNYWLNSIILNEKLQRDKFLKETNANGVMTRPIWNLMNKLPMFKDAQCDNLKNSEWLQERIVNIPSSVRL